MPASPALRLRFWGVRGSIPCPGPSTSRYGGNTSCIELLGEKDVIVFDAGTGLRELGETLIASGKPQRIHLLLSHTHWDHIQGFPFFSPIYSPANQIFIYGPRSLEKPLRDAVLFQMQYSYFPVRGVELQAKVEFRELDEETFRIGDVEIRTLPMNHPIRVLAYRFQKGKRTGLYTGDNEPYYDLLSKPSHRTETAIRRANFVDECNDRVVEFVRGTDTLVADAQYTDEEYPSKQGWGHSSLGAALSLATRAKVKKLVLFHHEPTHTDREMAVLERSAVQRARKLAPRMKVLAAREGMTVGV